MRFALVHRDNATYNWPWQKTGVRKSIPTNFTDWPCDLLMVIAYANRIRNWHLVIFIGISADEGDSETLGMNTKFSHLSPINIWASITCSPHFITTNRVPLQSHTKLILIQTRTKWKYTFNEFWKNSYSYVTHSV